MRLLQRGREEKCYKEIKVRWEIPGERHGTVLHPVNSMRAKAPAKIRPLWHTLILFFQQSCLR